MITAIFLTLLLMRRLILHLAELEISKQNGQLVKICKINLSVDDQQISVLGVST